MRNLTCNDRSCVVYRQGLSVLYRGAGSQRLGSCLQISDTREQSHGLQPAQVSMAILNSLHRQLVNCCAGWCMLKMLDAVQFIIKLAVRHY